MLTLKEKIVGTKETENKEQRLYFVDELNYPDPITLSDF
jgi:hypothetical protein